MDLRRRRADAVALLVILAGSLFLVGLHVHRYTTTSPIDELSHIDTLIKTSHLHVVEGDERVGRAAMREQACRGISREDRLPPCDTETFNTKEFPDYGVNVISNRFPVYHLLTGLPARALTWLPGVDSVVGTARLLGALWLAAGLFLTWLLMAELEIRVAARVVALVLLATSPLVLHAQSIVNSDATLLFGGAAVGYVAVRWERAAAPTWALVATAVGGIVLEATTLLAVTLWALYLLGRSGGGRRRRRRRGVEASDRAGWEKLAAGVTLLAVGVAVFVALPVAHRVLIGTADPIVSPPTPAEAASQHQASEVTYGPVPPGKVVGELTGLVSPLKRPYIPPFLGGDVGDLIVRVSDALLLGAVLAVAALTARRSRAEVLAVAALGIMLSAGPFHALWNARRDVFFAIPTRFGLPILPALFGLLAGVLLKRWLLIAVGVVSAVSAGYTLIHLI